MARFLSLQFQEDAPGGAQIVSADALRRMQLESIGWGVGWGRYPAIEHTGGHIGFYAHVMAIPKLKIGIVTLTNSDNPIAPYGLDFYLSAAFWLILWCLLLIWALSSRLRRGLRREIDQLAEGWNHPSAAAGIFAQLEDGCCKVEQFRQELDHMEQHVAQLRRQLALPDEQLGHLR